MCTTHMLHTHLHAFIDTCIHTKADPHIQKFSKYVDMHIKTYMHVYTGCLTLPFLLSSHCIECFSLVLLSALLTFAILESG